MAWVFLCAACGGDEAAEAGPAMPLAVPAPSASIDGLKATLRWMRIDNARSYEYELYAGSDEAPATGSVPSISYSFEMAEGLSYRFRVRAVPAVGSAYAPSAWSEEVALSNDMLAAPVVVLDPEALTRTSARLFWDEVAGAAAYACELYEGSSSTAVRSERVEKPEIRFDDLTEGTSYRCRAKALASAEGPGEDSPFSAFLSFATRQSGQLAAPVMAAPSVSSGGVTLTWGEVEGCAGYGYELYKENDAAPCLQDETTASSVRFDDLETAVTYRFRVRALAAAEEEYLQSSEWSSLLSFVVPGSSEVDFGLPLAHENDGRVRAFPGAEGGGMYVTGGRGGAVYHVTTLEDNSSAGSFRYAVTRSGARTVVFDVAGDIVLKSDLKIKNGDLTIAGQTAPGDGVCIRGGTVQVDADNIIIRYMRFRLGDESSFLSDGSDAVWGRYHENIILDHCSMSWSIDEVASFYANRNFTMQWCIVAEALRESVHAKGAHGYGGIWGGRNASFHHNMLANNDSRNARIDHPGIYLQNGGATDYRPTHRGNVDYRNNVIYNWGSNSTYGGEDGHYNMVGNYYKPGPASAQRNYFLDAYWYNASSKIGEAYPVLYLEGNYHAGSYASAINADQWTGIYFHDQGANPSTTAGRLDAPLSILSADGLSCHTTTHSAADAFEAVLSHAGASLRRDDVDTRIAGEARTATATSGNGLINSQNDVGGWPVLTATADELAQAKDSDGDGIPDHYEVLFGLDSANKADGNLRTLDPQGLYTNLEVYLHYLVREITTAQVEQGEYRELK